MEHRWPTFDEVAGILHELAIGLYGNAGEQQLAFRIENPGLLDSALALPHQPYYETFFDKLAALVRSIAANHALADGNKRLAITVLHSTLLVNGYLYTWSDDDAVNIALRCATGDTDFRWLAEFIEAWASPVGDAIPLHPRLMSAAIAIQRHLIGLASRELGEIADETQDLIARHAKGELPPDVIRQLLDERRHAAAGG